MTKSRAKAAFRLSKFSCGLEEITKALAVSPTRSWRLGDLISGTTLQRQSNGWELASRLSEDQDISDHIDDIVSMLRPIISRINGLHYGEERLMSCVLYVKSNERPPIFISNTSLSVMAEIKAAFDLDMYYLP